MNSSFLRQNALLWFVLVGYSLAFVAVIIAANAGLGSEVWSFVGEIPLGDKLGHLLLVGTLSLLFNCVLGGRRAPGRLRSVMLGSLLVFVGMTLEEASQCFNPHRNCDPYDWLANVLGIAIGEVIIRFSGRLKVR